MKHSRWLLTLVLILLSVNLVFFGIWYGLNIQGKAKARLEGILSTVLEGKLTIAGLSINDRQVIATNIDFISKDKLIKFRIKQVQVRYNLFRLLLSGLKLQRAKAEIVLYEPVAEITYKYKPSTSDKPFDIPELAEYFHSLEVRNGGLSFTFIYPIDSTTIGDFTYKETFNKINVSVKNSKGTSVEFEAKTNNQGILEAKAEVKGGYISSMLAQIDNYKPLSLDLHPLDNLTTGLNARISYSQTQKQAKPDIDFNIIASNTTATYSEHNLNIPLTSTYGNLKNISFDIRDITLNNNRLSVMGKATNFLINPDFTGTIIVDAADLNEFEQDLHGMVSGNVNVSGTINDLFAQGKFVLQEGMYQSEVVNNVNAEATFENNIISFSADNFQWRLQDASTKGSYDLKTNTLDIDVKTNPSLANPPYSITSDLSAHMEFADNDVNIKINVKDIGLRSDDIIINNLQGSVSIINSIKTEDNTIATLSLSNNNGLKVVSQGNLDSILINTEVEFNLLPLADYIPHIKKQVLNPMITGITRLDLINGNIEGSSNIDVKLDYFHVLQSKIDADYRFNLDNFDGKMRFTSTTDIGSGKPINADFNISLHDDMLRIDSLIVDNNIKADAWMNIKDFTSAGLKLSSHRYSISKVMDIFSNGDKGFPINADLDIDLDYNYHDNQVVQGTFLASNILIPELQPLSIPLSFSGTTQKIDISGSLKALGDSRIDFNSVLNKSKDYKEVNLTGSGSFNNLKASDVLADKKIKGIFSGTSNWSFAHNNNIIDKYPSGQLSTIDYHLACDVKGHDLLLQNVAIDSIAVDVSQSPEFLLVNNLLIKSNKLFSINGMGRINYDVLSGSITQGNHSLELNIDGDILRLLSNNTSFVENANSRFKASMELKLSEEGIGIDNGRLSLTKGSLQLKDQINLIDNIDIQGRIIQNHLFLDKFNCNIGQGKLIIKNKIDESDDNFYIGPLNLGYFLVRTDDNGIQVSIPGYLSDNTTARAVIKGQKGRDTTIKGPFDDMEIKGLIVAYDASVVYPPNTKNILQLVDLFQNRQKTQTEEIPLPFTLDLFVELSENVNYVTYPANLNLLKGSFLRLTYDGSQWDAREAEFMSEKGTLDFYGTVFDAEFIKLEINSQQNLIAVNGAFTKKAADGTLVTLSVITDLQSSGEIMDKLSFKLTSDNPQDRTNIQILSRLRYGRNIEELDPNQRQSLLQDEAMQLISTSVNTTYVSQFLSPMESKIKKWLRLDSFAITTGFVQNLFVEFTNNNEENNILLTDPNNINSDILQFSSSILLNNLSLSMGKYLGKNTYLDYRVRAQETTDLAKKTRIDLYHDATLRYNLPWKLSLSYTFGVKPAKEKNTHEIMLHRSFRF